MKFRRFPAAVLAAAMLTAAVPFTASAEGQQNKHVVVLGDATAAGSGLAESSQSVAGQIAGYLNADISVFAEEANTTADVLAALEQTEVRAALAQADVILVSAGMYDVMIPYMQSANKYLEEFGLTSFSELYNESQASLGLTDTDLLMINTELNSKPRTNKETALANIKEIGQNLSQYQNAQVIYLNVYHPLNTLEFFSSLSAKRQNAYLMGAVNPVSVVLSDPGSINPTYSELSDSYSCTVVDAYALFDGKAYLYCDPAELDIRLNADGHDLLALQTAKDAGFFAYGNLDGDDEITASDAALLLMHSAAVGAGEQGVLNALQETAADVNGDNAVDAADAASILAYAAALGSGEIPPVLGSES